MALTRAQCAVAMIIRDLTDRCGLKSEWHQIEEGIQAEIKRSWAGLIELAYEEAEQELANLRVTAEARLDCHAGPGTTKPACGACITCVDRLRAAAEAARDEARAREKDLMELLCDARCTIAGLHCGHDMVCSDAACREAEHEHEEGEDFGCDEGCPCTPACAGYEPEVCPKATEASDVIKRIDAALSAPAPSTSAATPANLCDTCQRRNRDCPLDTTGPVTECRQYAPAPASPTTQPEVKLAPGQYHPDPEIDAAVRREHIEGERLDRAVGLGFTEFGQRKCATCGYGNHDVRKNCRNCGDVLPPVELPPPPLEPAAHELKAWPEYFEEIVSGRKRFELRVNDRGFKVGDVLRLREYIHVAHTHLPAYAGANPPVASGYTGRELAVRVTYLVQGEWGLPPNLCVMSIEPTDAVPSKHPSPAPFPFAVAAPPAGICTSSAPHECQYWHAAPAPLSHSESKEAGQVPEDIKAAVQEAVDAGFINGDSECNSADEEIAMAKSNKATHDLLSLIASHLQAATKRAEKAEAELAKVRTLAEGWIEEGAPLHSVRTYQGPQLIKCAKQLLAILDAKETT